MKKFIAATGLAALVLTSAARADEAPAEKVYPSKSELTGMIGGAGIGAIVAGPVGFMMGMALGDWIGERMHYHKETSRMLANELDAVNKKNKALNAKAEETDRTVEALEAQLQASRATLAKVNEGS